MAELEYLVTDDNGEVFSGGSVKTPSLGDVLRQNWQIYCKEEGKEEPKDITEVIKDLDNSKYYSFFVSTASIFEVARGETLSILEGEGAIPLRSLVYRVAMSIFFGELYTSLMLSEVIKPSDTFAGHVELVKKEINNET